MDDKKFAGLEFEQVVRKYSNTVGKVCIMRLKNWADAEDCFQNIFATLYKKSPHFESEEHLKAWLIRVSINECVSFLRTQKTLLPLKDVVNTASFENYDSLDVSWALFELEPKYRNVLYLFYFERYKIDKIAHILGKKSTTVKTLLRRGKDKLRKIYGSDVK